MRDFDLPPVRDLTNIGVTWFPHWMLCKAFPGRRLYAEAVLARNNWSFGRADCCWRQLNWVVAREHSSPRQVLQPIRDELLLSKGGGESSSREPSPSIRGVVRREAKP